MTGGNRLEGTVQVEGAKNSVLPVIAASIMASEGKSTLDQVPTLADVDTISEVLRYMNVNVFRKDLYQGATMLKFQNGRNKYLVKTF